MSLHARKIRMIMNLRRAGLTDGDVLNAIERIPRELFVLDHFHDQAYEDQALPISHGQTISRIAASLPPTAASPSQQRRR